MDVERTVECILEQQAAFTAGMQELREQQRAMQQRHQDLLTEVQRIAGLQLDFVQYVKESQENFGSALLTLAEAQRALAEAQRHTDERLNALITVVDGIVRRIQ